MLKYRYRGYDDPSVRPESESRAMVFQYLSAFRRLLEKEHAGGRVDACREALARFLNAFPPERVGFEKEGGDLRGICG
jgi:hypothetical protein